VTRRETATGLFFESTLFYYKQMTAYRWGSFRAMRATPPSRRERCGLFFNNLCHRAKRVLICMDGYRVRGAIPFIPRLLPYAFVYSGQPCAVDPLHESFPLFITYLRMTYLRGTVMTHGLIAHSGNRH
jgi:hypothetical protein